MESIVVTPPLHLPTYTPPPPAADLLRELIEVQREQLVVTRAMQAGLDDRARWRGMHARHAEEFPQLPGECRTVLPLVEKAYLTAVGDLTAELNDEDADLSDFRVNELLDKHVPKLGQLWAVLSQVSQLAALAPAERP